jgi:hypothetical protein
MNFLPVITRELQAQARQSFTYWLRVLGLITLLGGSIFFLSDELFEANLGGRLFGSMHLLCYLAIWVFVPLSAADCISRERREGTLGIAFSYPAQTTAHRHRQKHRAWTPGVDLDRGGHSGPYDSISARWRDLATGRVLGHREF